MNLNLYLKIFISESSFFSLWISRLVGWDVMITFVTNVWIKQIWIPIPNGFLLIANVQTWSGIYWLYRAVSHPHTWRSIARMYGLTDVDMTGVVELPNSGKCLNTIQTIGLKFYINNNVFYKRRDPPSVIVDRANPTGRGPSWKINKIEKLWRFSKIRQS